LGSELFGFFEGLDFNSAEGEFGVFGGATPDGVDVAPGDVVFEPATAVDSGKFGGYAEGNVVHVGIHLFDDLHGGKFGRFNDRLLDGEDVYFHGGGISFGTVGTFGDIGVFWDFRYFARYMRRTESDFLPGAFFRKALVTVLREQRHNFASSVTYP